MAAIVLVLLPFVSSATICCEKTLSGSICQNTAESNCAPGTLKAETSCEQTSFCKLGTCIDNDAGECRQNTERKSCENIGGAWDERDADEISQCKLGCCFIGNGTTFVTKTQCKTISGLYGLELSFDNSITNFAECIASGASEDMGACVYTDEEEFGNMCKLTTEKECRQLDVAFADSNAEFYKDYLCTAEELNTNCAATQKTICNDEGVYFLDSCGNLANIYDSGKYNDEEYWTKIVERSDSCGIGKSNANSATCGNCNYNLGSTCSKAKSGETSSPRYGDYICRDLSCEYDNDGDGDKETYQHGEKWCAITSGTSPINENKTEIPNSFIDNVPGSNYVVLSCRNGEVDYEICGEGARDHVCLENTIYPDGVTAFKNAKCSVNLWQDCTSISTKEDCEDIEKRDCKWIPIFSRTDDDRLTTWIPRIEGDSAPLIKTDGNLPKGKSGFDISEILNMIKNGGIVGLINLNNYKLGNPIDDIESNFQNGACVPRYAPGFDFTGNITKISGKENSNEAADICSLASATCVIKKEKSLGGTWEAVENSECEPDPNGPYLWYESMRNICASLGDCGSTVNYIGEEGDDKKDIITSWGFEGY